MSEEFMECFLHANRNNVTEKIAFCIACMTMTSRASAWMTTKKIGKFLNTVTFYEREFSVYIIDI